MAKRRAPGKNPFNGKGKRTPPQSSKKVRKSPPRKYTPPPETLGRMALEDQLHTARVRARRYVGIENVLTILKLNHPLKRQAVHAACETAAGEMRDIMDQYTEIEAREKTASFQAELREHPEYFEKKNYAQLCRAYNVRPTDSLDVLKDRAYFLKKLLRGTTRLLHEAYETPPHELEKIFGKKSAPTLWKILRKEVFPGKLPPLQKE